MTDGWLVTVSSGLVLQTVSTPIVAAVLGALLGSLSTLLTQLYLQDRRRAANRRNLRLALGAELADLGNALRWADDAGMSRSEWNAFVAALPTKVYDTRGGDLGRLTERELTNVIKFYDSLTAAGGISETELSEEFDDDFELGYNPDDLLVRHGEAVDALRPNLHPSDMRALGLELDRSRESADDDRAAGESPSETSKTVETAADTESTSQGG
jgi:hypothetical protein